MIKHLQISVELLTQFLTTGSGLASVSANPLPPDARIVGCRMINPGVPRGHTIEGMPLLIELEIASDAFTDETPDVITGPSFVNACPCCQSGGIKIRGNPDWLVQPVEPLGPAELARLRESVEQEMLHEPRPIMFISDELNIYQRINGVYKALPKASEVAEAE